ncbi:MAG: endolytic transglycosylase MltG [Bacteroidetes bacterium]|nr:endolytic transglycosylase MltG [Bacteroidota bacterium]MDA1224195.1 endolytic transglycosylase MltG [Bacteroidota bacterium]
MGKKWIWALVAIGALTVGLKFWLLPNWYSTNSNNVALTYETPISFDKFDAMVKDKTGLSTPLSLAKIASWRGLKLSAAGTSTLVIRPKTSFWSLIKLLVRYQREQKMVIILSHWDYNQFQKQLSKQFDWSPTELGEELMDPTNQKRWNEQTWLNEKGLDSYNWQAIAIPNSYMFKRTATPIQVLDRLVKEAHDFWTKERMLAASKLGLTPVEVVKLASIVTKESNHIPEYGKIASTYKNRLKIGMLLQADPTVVFARGRAGRVLNRDTKIESPYNTYLHTGLPIGALCIPSHNAIDSCLFGAQYPYVYFCAKADLTPQHDFAIALDEHNKNAQRFHRALNALKNK